jgi:hypothetical protein
MITSTNQSICPFSRVGQDLSKKVLTIEEKTWFANESIAGRERPITLWEKYYLNESTTAGWARAIRNGIPLRSGGRPKRFTAENGKAVTDILSAAPYAYSKKQFKSLLNEEVKKNEDRENKPVGCFKELSNRSVDRIEKNLGISTGLAEITTNARALAVADVRNAVSFGVMNQLMVPMTHPSLILNSDATQYKVGYNSDDKVLVKYIKNGTDSDEKDHLVVLPSEGSNQSGGITAYFIKFYSLLACGSASNPVFMIAEESLGDDEIRVIEVPYLG